MIICGWLLRGESLRLCSGRFGLEDYFVSGSSIRQEHLMKKALKSSGQDFVCKRSFGWAGPSEVGFQVPYLLLEVLAR